MILPVTAAIAICVFGAGSSRPPASGARRRRHRGPGAGRVDLTAADEQHGRADPPARSRGPLADGRQSAQHPRSDVHGGRHPAAEPGGVVAGAVDAGTTASDITEARRLTADVPTLTGRRVGLTVDNRTRGGQDPRLRLVAPGEAPHFAFLGPFGRGRAAPAAAVLPFRLCRRSDDHRRSGRVDGGRRGRLRIKRPGRRRDTRRGWDRRRLVEPGTGVLGRRDHHRPGHRGRGLVLDLDSRRVRRRSSSCRPGRWEALPVVKGVDATTAPKSGSFSSTSANEFAVDPVILTERAVPRAERPDDRLRDAQHQPHRLRAELHRLRAGARRRPGRHARRACRSAARR